MKTPLKQNTDISPLVALLPGQGAQHYQDPVPGMLRGWLLDAIQRDLKLKNLSWGMNLAHRLTSEFASSKQWPPLEHVVGVHLIDTSPGPFDREFLTKHAMFAFIGYLETNPRIAQVLWASEHARILNVVRYRTDLSSSQEVGFHLTRCATLLEKIAAAMYAVDYRRWVAELLESYEATLKITNSITKQL